jgi:hypothetical protein
MDPVGDRPESAASPAVRGIPAQLPSVTMAGKARSHGGGRQSASAVTVATASGVKAGVALGERTGAWRDRARWQIGPVPGGVGEGGVPQLKEPAGAGANRSPVRRRDRRTSQARGVSDPGASAL